MAKKTTRDSDQFLLRLPDGMRSRIEAAAEANHRSMTAEIVALLEERFPELEPSAPDLPAIMDLLNSASSPDDFAAKAREVNRQFEAAGSPYRVDMVSPIPGKIAFSRTPKVPVPAENERFVGVGRIVRKKD